MLNFIDDLLNLKLPLDLVKIIHKQTQNTYIITSFYNKITKINTNIVYNSKFIEKRKFFTSYPIDYYTFLQNSSRIVSLYDDTLQKYEHDIVENKEIKRFNLVQGYINLSEDRTKLLCFVNNKIIIKDAQNYTIIKTLNHYIEKLEFMHLVKNLLHVYSDSYILFIDINTGDIIRLYSMSANMYTAVSMSTYNNLTVDIRDYKNKCSIFEHVLTNKRIIKINMLKSNIKYITRISNNMRLLAYVSTDRHYINIIDLLAKKIYKVNTNTKYTIDNIHFIENNKKILVKCIKQIYIIDIEHNISHIIHDDSTSFVDCVGYVRNSDLIL